MLAYRMAGMGWFDALCHSFSTVAIGGFSTHDANIGYFDSGPINIVAIIFMFVAGINFSLHFFAWRYVSIKHYFQDPEFKAYAFILIVISIIVVATLYQYRGFTNPGQTFIGGLFHAVSIATTTGFTTENFALWPAGLPSAEWSDRLHLVSSPLFAWPCESVVSPSPAKILVSIETSDLNSARRHLRGRAATRIY